MTDTTGDLAITDETDLLTTIPRETLIYALDLAREQIDEADDDELPAYGLSNAERDAHVAALTAALADLA